jgi:glycosyltransferase involved in cell wall biosynthesis
VIVPVYNEEKAVGTVLEKLIQLRKKLPMEILVVDDGSVDETVNVVKTFPYISIISHPKNMGKGKAIATGLSKSRGEVVVIQDADGEYAPEEIQRIVAPILEKRADIVFGSRFLRSTPNYGMSISHKFGNVILSFTASLLYNTKITDIMTGHKAFSREAINSINLLANGFEIEVEMTGKLLKKQWRLLEVPISYIKRRHGEAKITALDGLTSLAKLILYRLI